MLTILIIEDSPRMAGLLEKGLAEEGFMVRTAADGHRGLDAACSGDCDLVLLDINLPGMDGFTLMRELRKQRSDVPVIMITARDTVDDRVTGLDAGADDYLVKPFVFEELLARIRAVSRRPGSRQMPPLRYGDVELDSASGKAWRAGIPLPLTAKEFNLLRAFLQNPEQDLSREAIERQAWQSEYDGTSNRLDVYVNYLRNKLRQGGRSPLIHTIRGKGYRFDINEENT